MSQEPDRVIDRREGEKAGQGQDVEGRRHQGHRARSPEAAGDEPPFDHVDRVHNTPADQDRPSNSYSHNHDHSNSHRSQPDRGVIPDHRHQTNHGYRAADRRSLLIALALTGGYLVVAIAGGVLANSLSLLADALHMVTDTAAIGLALLALWMAGRPTTFTRTFGLHRAEILAALVNAVSLWAITVWIFYEAYGRLTHPREVEGGIMLAVGLGGLLVNLVVAWMLHHSAGHSLNVQGAFLHVIGDLLGSIAVVAGSFLIIAFGWTIADPVFGVIIGILILVSSGYLLWRVGQVLMEGVPAHLDLDQLCQGLEEVPGVVEVHDIHAWSITTGYDVLSAHVIADFANQDTHDRILHDLQDAVYRRFNLAHMTVQLESSTSGCVEDHHLEHGQSSALEPAGD